jgi:hypothetical protein
MNQAPPKHSQKKSHRRLLLEETGRSSQQLYTPISIGKVILCNTVTDIRIADSVLFTLSFSLIDLDMIKYFLMQQFPTASKTVLKITCISAALNSNKNKVYNGLSKKKLSP